MKCNQIELTANRPVQKEKKQTKLKKLSPHSGLSLLFNLKDFYCFLAIHKSLFYVILIEKTNKKQCKRKDEGESKDIC